MGGTGTRREQKKQAIRDALEEAALRLFDRDGFSATTVEQIADEADVSRSTFFRYFTSKEAVLFDAYDTGVEAMSTFLHARPEEETLFVAYENALVELVLHPDGGPDREVAALRQRIIESDPSLKLRRDEVIHSTRFRIAQALAAREGRNEPARAHLLAASVGVAVVERITDLFVDPETSGDPEKIIRSEFALLRELLA